MASLTGAPAGVIAIDGKTVRRSYQEKGRKSAAFPKGNAWLSLRDELGTIYSDEMFVGLYPSRGQPAEAP